MFSYFAHGIEYFTVHIPAALINGWELQKNDVKMKMEKPRCSLPTLERNCCNAQRAIRPCHCYQTIGSMKA